MNDRPSGLPFRINYLGRATDKAHRAAFGRLADLEKGEDLPIDGALVGRFSTAAFLACGSLLTLVDSVMEKEDFDGDADEPGDDDSGT